MTTTAYDAKTAKAIFARVAEGKSLRAISGDNALDAKWERISDWHFRVPSFRAGLTHARQLHAETLVDEILGIVAGLNPAKTAEAGDIAKAKLRIDTLKWVIDLATENEHGSRKLEANAQPERIRLIRVATGVPRAGD